MKLILEKQQLISNLETLENYLSEGNDYQVKETCSLIKRGTCFVAYQIDKELRFAPSRFIGYIDNKLEIHLTSNKHGRDTNKAIKSILSEDPLPNEKLEKKYLIYCHSIGIKPGETGAFGVQRKFWKLDIQKDFQENIQLSGEFPEGKDVERLHKSRERNSQVILIAKQNFKNLNGCLFCQVCGFDFEKVYGTLGKDFIEGHHTVAVSEMTHDYKTKVEEIAILCSNCHRMVHKKRPWLTMKELHKILKSK